jgi:hypothetical protein
MPDMGVYGEAARSVNVLTPRIGITPGSNAATTNNLGSSTDDIARRQSMTEQLFHNKYDEQDSTTFHVAKLVTAAGVDMADMVSSAFPGVDRGAVWQQARNMGLNGLADFAVRNDASVGLTSGLVAGVVTAGIADAYLAPAIGARLASSTFLNSTKLYKWGQATLGGAKQLAIDSAASAGVNGELATVLATSGGRQLLRARVAGAVGKGVVSEVAVAGVTHTNQQMWSDDMSTNLALSALGIGAAGALGALGARFEMRQIANSDEVMYKRAAASDPYGYTWNREYQPTKAELDALGAGAQYKESVNLTDLMLQARQQVPETVGNKRAQLITNESKQVQQQANESLQKITNKGIDGVPNTSFALNDPTKRLETQHLTASLHDDPTSMFGFDSVGGGNFADNVITRNKTIEKLKDSDQVKDLRQAQVLESQEPLTLVNKTWMPDSPEARQLSKFTPAPVDLKPTTRAAGNFDYTMNLQNGGKISINEGGNIPNFEKLNITDQMNAIQGLTQVARKMVSNKAEFIVPKNPTWLQADFAQHFADLGGKVDTMTFAGFHDMDELAMDSFRNKTQAALAMSKAGKFDYWARLKLNLPLPSSLERIHSGNGDTLTQVMNGALKNPNMTAQEAREARTTLLSTLDLRDGIKTQPSQISGDLFNFNRNQEGQWMPMLTGYSSFNRITPELAGSREHLLIATAENKIFRMAELNKGILSAEMTKGLLAAPEFQSSMKILGLAADQVTGLGSEVSQGLGTILTRSMRYRDSPTMLATLKVREAVNKGIENYTNKFMTTVYNGVQNELASVPNRGSKALVDQWYSFAGGWDLKKAPVPQADGTFAFALDSTAKNEQRLGRAVGDDDLLLNPNTQKAVVVDDKAMQFLVSSQAGYKTLLKDTNAIRSSRGLSPINEKSWYVPPPSTKGKIVGFTIGADGKTVPGGAIVAGSQEEFNALRASKEKTLQPGQRFFSQAEIESTADLWDSAEMGWIDPGFIGGKKESQTGSLFGNKMNPSAMQDSLAWVSDRIQDIGQGTVRSLYDQQLSIARARSAAESAVAGGTNNRTIYDEWEATILGRPLSSVKPGEGTKVIKATEGLAQSVINSSWPIIKAVPATQVGQWISDLSARLGMKPITSFKSFDDLATQLGPHTPYAKVSEYMEANLRVSTPPELKAITSGINRLSASLLLRWFEIPNAAMNMLGIVTNMPSILRSPSTPLIGTLTSQTGKKIGVVDSYKILAQGFNDMLHGKKHIEWDTMVKNGDTTQSIAELNKQLSLINSRGAVSRVLLGDPNAKGFAARKGVDGLISLATDTTESMSRAWAHFVGLRLADANGVVGTEARHSFAREVANQAIANYNPLNKPELFQSSIGSMFGLFTSYMQQYNQRLFRWAEVGDYRSIGRQLATQSALFGVASTPGYNMFASLYQGHGENPEATLTDAIYAKFGPKVGAMIANGGIQEIPKIFGLDQGIALYSRGDANLRSPTLDPTKLMAGLNMLSAVGDTAWQVAGKALDGDSDLTMRGVSEIVARNMPNRAMKGALTVLANGGQDTDVSGQIVSDTQTWLESGLRVAGLRSTRQQGEIEAYYANSAQRRRLAGRMETLRTETRAALRSGTQPDIMALFNKYTKSGGSPTHFSQWLQDQMMTTKDTRGMNNYMDSLRSPQTQLEAWRYEMRR